MGSTEFSSAQWIKALLLATTFFLSEEENIKQLTVKCIYQIYRVLAFIILTILMPVKHERSSVRFYRRFAIQSDSSPNAQRRGRLCPKKKKSSVVTENKFKKRAFIN